MTLRNALAARSFALLRGLFEVWGSELEDATLGPLRQEAQEVPEVAPGSRAPGRVVDTPALEALLGGDVWAAGAVRRRDKPDEAHIRAALASDTRLQNGKWLCEHIEAALSADRARTLKALASPALMASMVALNSHDVVRQISTTSGNHAGSPSFKCGGGSSKPRGHPRLDGLLELARSHDRDREDRRIVTPPAQCCSRLSTYEKRSGTCASPVDGWRQSPKAAL
jgi:hypothetical protein